MSANKQKSVQKWNVKNYKKMKQTKMVKKWNFKNKNLASC